MVARRYFAPTRPTQPLELDLEIVYAARNVLDEAVQLRDRVVDLHRRIEQQHLVEVERLALLVEHRHERGVRAADAVAGEVKVRRGRVRSDLCPDLLHHDVDVLRVVPLLAGHHRRRRRDDERRIRRRCNAHDVESGGVERVHQELREFAVVRRTGAGDHEDQRRGSLLRCVRVVETRAIAQHVGNHAPFFERQPADLERDVFGNVCLQFERRAHDSREVRIRRDALRRLSGNDRSEREQRDDEQTRHRAATLPLSAALTRGADSFFSAASNFCRCTSTHFR